MTVQSVDRALGFLSLFGSNREEMIPVVAAVGMPVFSGERCLAGVIGVSLSTRIILGERCAAFAQQLLCTASEITHAMGYYLSTDYRQGAIPCACARPSANQCLAPRTRLPVVRNYSKRV